MLARRAYFAAAMESTFRFLPASSSVPTTVTFLAANFSGVFWSLRGIEAVCVDMCEPFRLSLEQWVPGGKIIYDKFHVLGHANDAVDEVRKAEFFRQGRE